MTMAFVCRLLVVACTMVQACSSKRGEPIPHDLKPLASELGFPCPAGTRVLYLEHQGRDGMVRAKLEMSRELYARVVPQLPIKEEDLEPGSGVLGGDEGEWNPDATPGLRSGQVPIENFRTLHLSVAAGPGGAITVFVMTHGT